MCISAATALMLAAGGSVASTLYSADQQRKRANQAEDAAREATQRVETNAAQSANARLAQRRRALAEQSLVTDTAGMGMGGRATLGGG